MPPWTKVGLPAALVWLFISGLFFYWYGVADRYSIFLYGHLGLSPFDELTRSRYWMSGLVASGAVLVIYTSLNWLVGQLARVFNLVYHPAAWWRVWLGCALPVGASVLSLTLTLNHPTLWLSDASLCALITLLGLGLALMPGARAAERPGELGWLALTGCGLMPGLLLFRIIEQPDQHLIAADTAYAIALGSTLAGAVWLIIAAWAQRHWGHLPVKAGPLLASGLSLSYLLLPLAHHLFLTPPEYRYITAAGNFFAASWVFQLLSLAIALGLALSASRIRYPTSHPEANPKENEL